MSLGQRYAGQDTTYIRSNFTVIDLHGSRGKCSNCVISLHRQSFWYVAIHISLSVTNFECWLFFTILWYV